MTPLSALGQTVLKAAECVVPPPLRDAWREEWRGRLWDWLRKASTQSHEGRSALLAHLRAAAKAALEARFRSEDGIEAWRKVSGHAAFCLLALTALLTLLGLLTGGFALSRQLAKGLPYPDADRVVLLAQGPPTLGVRLGFLEKEADIFRKRATSLESMATYAWFPMKLPRQLGGREVTAAGVSRDFFAVLRAGPPILDDDAFMISRDFFERGLHGDAALVGQRFEIDGAMLRLAGIAPGGFSFLNTPVSLWLVRTTDAPPATPERWWLSLRGAVARLRPGVSPEAASEELRRLLVEAGVERSNSRVLATPVSAVVYRALRTYGTLCAAILAALFLWTAILALRDRGRGRSVRFYGFLLLKSSLAIVTVFLFVFEFSGVNRLNVAGGIWGGTELLAMWLVFCGVMLTLLWAWRDQRGRCRECLRKMHQPVRMGVRGHILLDPAGEEVICPRGHGSIYTSDSILGSGLSERWLEIGR